MVGNRKFTLGLIYMLGSFALVGLAIWGGDAGVVAAASGGCVSVSPGVAAVVWGNVKEHQAKIGQP